MFNRLNSNPTVTYCTFTGNSAQSGAGMCNSEGMATITHCNFIGNSASDAGGGMSNIESSSTVSSCTFTDNLADRAGEIFNRDSNITVINCVFTGNMAIIGFGGGLYNSGTSSTVTNCTFTGNLVNGYGGGMCTVGSSTTIMTNCIAWGNSPDNIYGPATISYSAIEGGWPGDGNIDADPLFVAGSLCLSEGSPCINAGTNTPPGGLPSTDIEGNPRIVYVIVDMGAYEAPAPGPEALLEYLKASILEAIESGSIDSTMEVSLIAKIDSALAALAQGNPNNPTVVMNDMEALINQVEAQTDKKITTEIAAEIISIANQIIEALAE